MVETDTLGEVRLQFHARFISAHESHPLVWWLWGRSGHLYLIPSVAHNLTFDQINDLFGNIGGMVGQALEMS